MPFAESPAERRQRNHEQHNGRFRPGNVAALKHGASSVQVRRALAESSEATQVLAEHRAAIQDDQGGTDALSTIKGDVVEAYVEIHMLRAHLSRQLVEQGLFTAKGRVRSTFGAFLQVSDRFVKLATLLGLDRQERDLGALSAADYLRHVAAPPAPPAAPERTPDDPDQH